MNFDAPNAVVRRVAASSAAPHSVIDADTRDNVIARRNILAGLWAGRLMQLQDGGVEDYAARVHQIGQSCDRQDGVIDKLFDDLNRCGVAVTREEIRSKLCEFHRQAIMQTRETD